MSITSCHLAVFPNLILTTALKGRYYYLHFPGEETEAIKKEAEGELEPSVPRFKAFPQHPEIRKQDEAIPRWTPIWTAS